MGFRFRDILGQTHMAQSHDEEFKDGAGREGMVGKDVLSQGTLATLTATQGDTNASRMFLLRLAFLFHVLMNLGQTVAMMWRPDAVLPGFVHGDGTLPDVWPIVRVFALQTGIMSWVALMVAFKFNYEDKVTMNKLFLVYHLLATVNMIASGAGTVKTLQKLSPAWYHMPTTFLHLVAYLFDVTTRKSESSSRPKHSKQT